MSRDPKRIKPTLKAIQRIWEKYPDQRLGQLLINLAGHSDPYNIEESEWIERATNPGWETSGEKKESRESSTDVKKD